MKKRILSILLALCMLMSLLPVAAFATDEEPQEDPATPKIVGWGYSGSAATGKDVHQAFQEAYTGSAMADNGGYINETLWVVFDRTIASNENYVIYIQPLKEDGTSDSDNLASRDSKTDVVAIWEEDAAGCAVSFLNAVQISTDKLKDGDKFQFALATLNMRTGAATPVTDWVKVERGTANTCNLASNVTLKAPLTLPEGVTLNKGTFTVSYAAPTKPNAITPAILHDTTGAVPDSALNTSYSVATSGASDEALGCYVTTINVSATALKPQANAQDPAVAAYWTGFAAVPNAEYSSVNKMKVAMGTDAASLAAAWAAAETVGLQGAVAGNKSGLARYFARPTEEELKNFNGRLFRVQWYQDTTPVGEIETYKLNFDGVKFDPNPVTITSVTVKVGDNVSESVRASAENGVITLTGAMPDSKTDYTLVCTTSAGGSLAVKATVTPAADDNAASCVIAKATGHDNVVLSADDGANAGKGFFVVNNEYTVSMDLKSVDATIVPPAATGSVTIPNVSDETKTALESVMNSTKATGLTALVVEEEPTTPEPTATEVTNALAEANININTVGQTVIVVVQPYLDIQATGYVEAATAADAPKSLTLEIDAKYRAVATTATNPTNPNAVIVKGEEGDGKTANAAVVGTPTTLTVDDPIDISVTLPSGFAASDSDTIYVKHVKNGNNYFYKGTVADDVATFTSVHGLSPFTFYATFTPKAQIGDTYFESLQEAVNAVQNGQVITALDDGTATVSKEVSFTVVPNEHTATITVGSGFKNNSTAPSYDIVRDGGGSSSSGGGSSASVSIPSTSNGKVTVSNSNAKKGDTVTITLTPNDGYVVDTVTVTDSKGNTVEVSKTDDTHYTFVMPEGRVTVKATFKKAEVTPPATGFTDVPADAYYADAVKWAVENNITNGLTATTFGPNNSCTRGQMVTFLWRAAGSPAATGTNSFTDVASGEYYYNAVLWAVEKGITNGTTATTFSPNATVNRGQTVTFLYRYAESPAATGTTSFTDVAADAYYADAVKWAVAEGITNGTSDTTFAPASNCTRGQIVTFLYRQIAE